MKRLIIISSTTLLLWTISAVAQTDPTVTGRKALDLLLAEKFPELTTMFNETMKANITMDVLKGRVGSELEGFGKAQGSGDPVVSKDGKNTLVSFPVAFAKTKVNVQFSVDEAGQLASIHFRPADSPLPTTWQHPAYSKADAFHERDVKIGSEPWQLGGTLTIPSGKGPFPAVVLVHGPGPNDRDESLYANKVFADIAEGLSSRGIVVLRYDKRTRTYGRQMSEAGFTLREETIEDALTAAKLVRQQPEVNPNRVYLLGHSLGGYAAPRIAKEDGKFAGLIFLAANARPVQDVVIDQTEYLATAGVIPAADATKRLAMLKAEAEKIQTLKPGGDNPTVVLGLPSAWLLDVKNYDPAAQARQLSVPMLFLQGERDFQVTMKDFDRWKSVIGSRPNVTYRSYGDLNYLFIHGEGKSVPTEYLPPGNVSPAVINDIADWISGSKK